MNTDTLFWKSITTHETESIANNPSDIDQPSLQYLWEFATKSNSFRESNTKPSTSTPVIHNSSSSENGTTHSLSIETLNDCITILDKVIYNKNDQILFYKNNLPWQLHFHKIKHVFINKKIVSCIFHWKLY